MTAEARATPEALATLHDLLARFWSGIERAALPQPPQDQRARFATAVIEIGSNIIRYAYPQRSPGMLALSLRAWPDCLEARFTDRGIQYEPSQGAAPVELPADESEMIAGLPEGGFGLALAQAAADLLDYDRAPDGENRWTIVSRLGRRGD